MILLLPNTLALAVLTAVQELLMPGIALLLLMVILMTANTPPLPLTLLAMPG